MAAIVIEHEFRGWIQRSLDALLRERGFKNVDTPDWFKSENREGANRFGKNGWFDYIRQLPGARYLILELKVCEDGVLREFKKDSQHKLLCALEICGVPVQYSWNNVHENDARSRFLDETLLQHCEAQPPSATAKKAPAPNRDLKNHVLDLLNSAGSIGDISRQPLPFLGLLTEKNASAVLVSIAVNDLDFSISEITPAFVAQISQQISQIELPEDWMSLNETDLAARLGDAFGGLFPTDIPIDGQKNNTRKFDPSPGGNW